MASGVPQNTSAPKRSNSGSPFIGALPGSPDPAFLREIEDHAVGILVLHFEVRIFLALAEREEELAARGLDPFPGLVEIVHLEAEMVRADEARRILEAGAALALVLEEREIDDAVAEVDGRAHVDVLLADALELEHALVEARRALEILHHHGDVPQLCHCLSIDP